MFLRCKRKTSRATSRLESFYAHGPPYPPTLGGLATPPELGAGGRVAEDLFEQGLCLPSDSNLTEVDLARVVGVVRGCRR